MNLAVTVAANKELFRFASLTQWVDKAKDWFSVARREAEARGEPFEWICVDQKGSVCCAGIDFRHAAYPVVVFRLRTSAMMLVAVRGSAPERIIEMSRIRRGRPSTSPLWRVPVEGGGFAKFRRKRDAEHFVLAGGCGAHPRKSHCDQCHGWTEP